MPLAIVAETLKKHQQAVAAEQGKMPHRPRNMPVVSGEPSFRLLSRVAPSQAAPQAAEVVKTDRPMECLFSPAAAAAAAAATLLATEATEATAVFTEAAVAVAGAARLDTKQAPAVTAHKALSSSQHFSEYGKRIRNPQ
jgi:hypothetical protein